METAQNSVGAFLAHGEFERNFSQHTIKAYRLDLAQFTRFRRAKTESDELAQVDRSFLRGFSRTLHHYKRQGGYMEASDRTVADRRKCLAATRPAAHEDRTTRPGFGKKSNGGT